MSVLESLYILVKLETDQLKKGLDDTQSQVKKLEHEFENLGRAGDHVSQSFDHVLRSAVGMFAGFASFQAILGGASGAVAGIREVGQAARELNVDVSALDAWGSAVERAGGSSSGFQSSLRSLAQHFGTTNDIALRALPKLADAFSKLNFTQGQNYGKSLGLDQSTILFLQQGRREVEATIQQQRQLGVVTKEQAENTRKFDMAIYDLNQAYKQFYREFSAPLLPGLTDAFQYIIKHKGVAIDAFEGIAAAVSILAARLALISPLFRVAAAIGAIGTAYGVIKEDVQAYQKGESSLIGDIVAPSPETKKVQEKMLSSPSGISRFINIFAAGSAFGSLAPVPNLTGNSPITVNVGGVNINTAATDAEGIAMHAANSMKKEIGQAISQIDNGVHK